MERDREGGAEREGDGEGGDGEGEGEGWREGRKGDSEMVGRREKGRGMEICAIWC